MKDNNYLKKELYELIKTDESIFDFIQESSLDGMWYWDLEKPEEEWMNPKFWSVLGYDHNEMPHKASAWQDIIHPDDLKLATANLIKHCENSNHPYDQTVRYTHKNGSTVWVRCRGMATRDKNGKPIRMLGGHHDITALKNSEIELRESEEKFRQTFAFAPIGMLIVSLTGKLIRVNNAFSNYLGYTVEEIKQIPFQGITHIDDQAADRKYLNELLNGKREFYQVEKRYIHKNGDFIWSLLSASMVSDSNKNPLYFILQVVDITERKQMEESMKENDRKLRDLTNNLNESSLISITNEKGTILEINKLFCELSGYTESELIGQNHRIINSGYHDKQFWLGMWKTISNGEIWRGEIKNRAKDGSEYWVASVINPVKDSNGKIKQYISIRQDITEKKRIELEKEEITKHLKYALDASGDGIWDWTPATGKTVFSKAWVEMLGYKMGEIPSSANE